MASYIIPVTPSASDTRPELVDPSWSTPPRGGGSRANARPRLQKCYSHNSPTEITEINSSIIPTSLGSRSETNSDLRNSAKVLEIASVAQ